MACRWPRLASAHLYQSLRLTCKLWRRCYEFICNTDLLHDHRHHDAETTAEAAIGRNVAAASIGSGLPGWAHSRRHSYSTDLLIPERQCLTTSSPHSQAAELPAQGCRFMGTYHDCHARYTAARGMCSPPYLACAPLHPWHAYLLRNRCTLAAAAQHTNNSQTMHNLAVASTMSRKVRMRVLPQPDLRGQGVVYSACWVCQSGNAEFRNAKGPAPALQVAAITRDGGVYDYTTPRGDYQAQAIIKHQTPHQVTCTAAPLLPACRTDTPACPEQ